METASCDVRDSKALPTLIQNQFMKICVIRVHCLCNFSPSGFIRVHMWLNWFFKKSALTCFLSPQERTYLARLQNFRQRYHQSSVGIAARRWERFPLSWGERAGVRAGFPQPTEFPACLPPPPFPICVYLCPSVANGKPSFGFCFPPLPPIILKINALASIARHRVVSFHQRHDEQFVL
jgi:hypothetical protein